MVEQQQVQHERDARDDRRAQEDARREREAVEPVERGHDAVADRAGRARERLHLVEVAQPLRRGKHRAQEPRELERRGEDAIMLRDEDAFGGRGPSGEARHDREAAAVQLAQHPNIVTCK